MDESVQANAVQKFKDFFENFQIMEALEDRKIEYYYSHRFKQMFFKNITITFGYYTFCIQIKNYRDEIHIYNKFYNFLCKKRKLLEKQDMNVQFIQEGMFVDDVIQLDNISYKYINAFIKLLTNIIGD